MTRRTKIVATIGPACRDDRTLQELIEAGMDVARLNFSHGTHSEHAQMFKRIRQIAAGLNKPVTILQDLQGPKIRTGEIQGGEVEIHSGQTLRLTSEELV